MKSLKILAGLGLQSLVSAHMLMSYPPSLRYQGNPFVDSGIADYSLTSPLKADGSDFPCKGYQKDLGTKAGTSVVTWAAGGSYNFTIAGGAPHNGGSCQAALSYDAAKTFTVIHSFIGGCPTLTGGSFDFQIPSDAPSGAALFSWTWFNNLGNREMYMDCASVTISGSGSVKRAGASFSSRPSIFIANIGNGCNTVESSDLVFPDPGPDVTDVTKAPGGITGTCKAVAGIGAFSSASGSPASSPSSGNGYSSSNTAASVTSPASSSPAAQSPSGFSTITTSIAPTASSTNMSSSNSLSPSADGSCGGMFTCQGSVHGGCCSQWGWCGTTIDYCGTGCQSAFGTCGTNLTSSGSTALKISTDKTCGPTTTNTCQGSSYGNCCSQFGYCGSTSEYCGTGCQSGFGICGLSSSSPSSPSSNGGIASNSSASSSPEAAGSTTTTTFEIDTTRTMTETLAPQNSATSFGFIGVTEPQPASPILSTFITSKRATTTEPPLSAVPIYTTNSG